MANNDVNKSQAIRDYYKANPTARTQAVVDALGKEGITVSVGLVNTVKSKHNRKQAARKAARNAPTSRDAKVTETKTEVNKTQAVRDYLGQHRNARRKEVVEALKAQGITVTASYVGTIKAKSKTRRKARRKAVRQVVATTGINMAQIKAAFHFIKECGDVAAAKAALSAADELKKLVL